ncbi:tRNA threonylcarbamoyladenosine dehydratase [Lawsonibacter faecis]|uniref:tRNA threonylcarbamoyladenosine dehydratase n=1 Tax=Lawsonibacter faecis TaxID=2763052 RepID=A0A8J6JMJ7_9FIRM|nr:tRNA threonylcarbamoyladenosine dehydratase [Lawsonibacter faecis]MBC5737639.1 tRNA threonylcarbamoyladenosine dehydratase [Lawsonibacter faecis]
MHEQFLRTEMVLGPRAMERLAAAHVAVLGLGGVGSWAAEALARAGVGELTLADHDEVGVTNINRQIEALWSTLGRPKAEALAERVLDINPNCRVHPLVIRYDQGTREEFFAPRYDYIVDAIDTVSSKLDLIETARERGVPVVSALGTGNKLDPAQFRITDISKTEGCPLARVIRKELRSRGIVHHRVLFSPEPPHRAEQREAPPPGRRSVPASVPWVPPVAGLMLAGDVVMTLAGLNEG